MQRLNLCIDCQREKISQGLRCVTCHRLRSPDGKPLRQEAARNIVLNHQHAILADLVKVITGDAKSWTFVELLRKAHQEEALRLFDGNLSRALADSNHRSLRAI